MRFEHFEQLDSTQDYVKALTVQGDNGPLWVRADKQELGRGRLGRLWVSKSGNLYTSGLYPWNSPLALKPLASFVTALALAEILDRYIDPTDIRLKWPNDVLVQGAKIAGILLEGGDNWLIIGIGLNLEHHPDDLAYPATHLLAHIAEDKLNKAEPVYAGPAPILAELAQNISDKLQALQSHGFAQFREDWLRRANRQGETIQVRLGNEIISGVFESLSENGALQLRLANGSLREIVAGDVLL